MASTIDATVGGSDSNSYVTMAEATTYMKDRLHKTAWDNAGSSDKAAALLWAAKIIDSRMEWLGQRATETQALSWPRVYAVDPDPAYLPTINELFGRPIIAYIPGDIIPNDIKYAQCEMALALLGSDLSAQPGSTGLNSLAVGSLKLDFAPTREQTPTIPRQVDELLNRYGVSRNAKKVVRKLVRS